MLVDLPNEILLEIFFFIRHDEIMNLLLTCERFRDVLSSNLFWKLKCQINEKLMTYLNQLLKKEDRVEELKIDWKRCFIEYINICTHVKMNGMGVDLNPKYEIDGYRHLCYLSDEERYGNVSFVRGKYRRGKWYFEMKIVERNDSAMSLGFCDPEMSINTDSEYELGFFGFYHGGVSRMQVSFGRRAKRTVGNSDGMDDGDRMGVMVDLENFKSISYSIKKSEIDPEKPIVRKIYYACDLAKDAKRSTRTSKKTTLVDDWYDDVVKKKEIVVSCHIWMSDSRSKFLFNYPAPVSREFMESFKLSGEENELFKDISELLEYDDCSDFFDQ